MPHRELSASVGWIIVERTGGRQRVRGPPTLLGTYLLLGQGLASL